MKIIFITILLLLSGCGQGMFQNEIVGKWKSLDDRDGIMVFSSSGDFEVLDITGAQINFSGDRPSITWESITEVKPNQLYITMNVGGKAHRVPFGIYKMENDKLIFREALEFNTTVGGFNFGAPRYEMPVNFSGNIKVFKRM
jgi:hypothetical protein